MRLNQDLSAGLTFLAFGAAGLVFAPAGRLFVTVDMGPGAFPTLLSGALVLLGTFIAARGLRRGSEPLPAWYFRPLLMVVAAFLVFALMLDPFGLPIAAIAMVLVASLGGTEFRLREALLLAILLAIFVVLLFVLVLGLRFHLLPDWT